jgi:signal transduction histidine kinase
MSQDTTSKFSGRGPHSPGPGFPWLLNGERVARHPGLFCLVGLLLAVGSLALGLFHLEQRHHANDVVIQGKTLTQVLTQATAHYATTDRLDELQQLVRGIQQDNVVYCAIVDADNRPVVQAGPYQQAPATVQATARGGVENDRLTLTTSQDAAAGATVWHFTSRIALPAAKSGSVHLGIQVASSGLGPWWWNPSVGLIGLAIVLLGSLGYYSLRSLLGCIRQLSDQLEASPLATSLEPLEAAKRSVLGTFVQRWTQVMAQTQSRMAAFKEANFELELTTKVLGYEKRRLEITLDRLADAILIADSSGKVVFANRMSARLLNTASDRIVGQALQECFPQENLRALLAENRALGHDVKVRNLEISFDTYQAEAFKATFSSILDNEEKFIGAFLLIRNITQQKIAEQARSEFISAVSHELKNPLSTVKSYVELLINQVIDDNTTKVEFYNTINDETDRMTRLIDNLLNLSKIELGLLQITPTRVRMRQLLADCFQAVESQASAKGIAFDLRLSEKLSALEVDKDLMGVVLMNLLSNALKYTPAGGEVALIAEETDAELVIHVRDSGIGIAEVDLPRIFERFYRGQNSDKAAGSGLGLALAQQIMYLHGGDLTVTSQQHQGSQFTLTLPKNQHMPQLINVGRQSHEDSNC